MDVRKETEVIVYITLHEREATRLLRYIQYSSPLLQDSDANAAADELAKLLRDIANRGYTGVIPPVMHKPYEEEGQIYDAKGR